MRTRAILALILGAALAGCAGAPSSINPASPATTAAAAEQETAAQVARIGQAATYPGGLQVAVTKLERRRVTAYNAGLETGHVAVVATVKVTNSGTEPFDAALLLVEARYGTDGTQAEAVFDERIREPISGTIQPGRSASGEYAFSVTREGARRVTISVNPSPFDMEPTQWEGAAR